MLVSVAYTEVLKYRKTLVPWLAVAGGLFPPFVAALFLLTANSPFSWEMLTETSLRFMNMLALLLIAVFAGHAFVSEYRDSRVNRLFTYPVPRFMLYAVKLIVAFLPVLGMYCVFAAATLASGWIFAGGPPDSGITASYLLLVLLVAASGLAVVPVTAFMSMMVKNDGSYILAGIGYFIIYMSFADSDISRLVPPCIPDRLLMDYMKTGHVFSTKTGEMLLACAAIFLLAFCLGAVCYAKREI